MRSKVVRRLEKETGKTLREVRRAKKIQKKLMTENERRIYNLKRAKRKVALLLQKLKKYELPDLPVPRHDLELFTLEQLQAFKKIGFRNKNYVPVGVLGSLEELSRICTCTGSFTRPYKFVVITSLRRKSRKWQPCLQG